jgi:hypothetical protein
LSRACANYKILQFRIQTPKNIVPRMKLNFKVICATGALALLIFLPTPLLPPQALVKALGDAFQLGSQAAYLVTVVGFQITLYLLIGVLAALAVNPARTLQGTLLQMAILAGAVVGSALIIRSIRGGHLPNYANAVVPLIGSVIGTCLGLGFLYKRVRTASFLIIGILGLLTAALLPRTSPSLKYETKAHLRAIVAVSSNLPSGDARFGAVLQVAFRPVSNEFGNLNRVEQNRASILAWGIAVGHPRLARLIGFDVEDELVNRAAALAEGTTLRGRTDWSRHYAVSAALTVLGHPLVSDAGGLMKEQLDALTPTSGFSFGDLAADRAGVRFGSIATSSEEAARTMQARIRGRYSLNDFFPVTLEFPENLNVAQFRSDFGGVGTSRYNLQISKIDAQLDSCAALLSAH